MHQHLNKLNSSKAKTYNFRTKLQFWQRTNAKIVLYHPVRELAIPAPKNGVFQQIHVANKMPGLRIFEATRKKEIRRSPTFILQKIQSMEIVTKYNHLAQVCKRNEKEVFMTFNEDLNPSFILYS